MTTTSFLPEDYLDRKAERRTNMISLTLFGIVMVSVFAVFLVTNRQWSQVKSARGSINSQYEDAATQIERLNELEQQKEQMLNKARLAAALVERVPRSILLAELTSRMPPRMMLLSFEMVSETIKQAKVNVPKGATGRLGAPARAPTREEAARQQKEDEKDKKTEVPAYMVSLTLIGMAATDLEVSGYIAELNAYPLLQGVTLDYSEERKIDGANMRQFGIKAQLNGKLDVRGVAPQTTRKQGANPEAAGPADAPGAARETAAAQPRREGG